MRMSGGYWCGELAPGMDWYGRGGDEIRLREPIAPQRSVYPSRRVLWNDEIKAWVETHPGRGAAAYTTGLVNVWNASRPDMRLGQLPDISGLDLSDLGSLAGNIDGLIEKIPTSNPKYAALKAELLKCLDKLEAQDPLSLYAGGKCLYDLYKDAKEASEEEEEKPAPAPKPSGSVPAPSGMGVGTLALIAAAGVGLVLALK